MTPEIEDMILSLIVDGEPLVKILKRPEIPYSRAGLYRYMRNNPEFRKEFEDAKRFWAELEAEEVTIIADEADGSSSSEVQKARLRFDARRWAASRLVPHLYGDKVQTEVSGKDGAMPVFKLNLSDDSKE